MVAGAAGASGLAMAAFNRMDIVNCLSGLPLRARPGLPMRAMPSGTGFRCGGGERPGAAQVGIAPCRPVQSGYAPVLGTFQYRRHT